MNTAERSEAETALAAAKRAVEALEALLAREVANDAAAPPTPASAPAIRPLAWGAKVSAVFRDRVRWIGEDLEFEPDWLMAAIAWESGRSFRSDVKNMAGSGATGLIQFMPATARGLGTTTEALAKLTPEDQLNFVWKYFAPFKGRIRSLADLYMAILWPKGVGQPDSYVLFDKGKQPTAYRQNAGLDADKDGKVTRRETVAKVAALLDEGRRLAA